jgi:hypothetical protein
MMQVKGKDEVQRRCKQQSAPVPQSPLYGPLQLEAKVDGIGFISRAAK